MSVDLNIWLSYGKWEIFTYEDQAFIHLRVAGDTGKIAIFCSSPSAAKLLAEAIGATCRDALYTVAPSAKATPAIVEPPPLEETIAGPPQVADDPRYVMPTLPIDRRDNFAFNSMEVDDDTPF